MTIANLSDDNVTRFSVPICTVPQAAAAALSGNIEVDPIRKRKIDVVSENITVNGSSMVRFKANVTMSGFVLIVR